MSACDNRGGEAMLQSQFQFNFMTYSSTNDSALGRVDARNNLQVFFAFFFSAVLRWGNIIELGNRFTVTQELSLAKDYGWLTFGDLELKKQYHYHLSASCNPLGRYCCSISTAVVVGGLGWWVVVVVGWWCVAG